MQQSGSGGPGNQGNMQGNMQKIGEGLGGLMGQAADNALGMFGTMMNNMGGWWAQAGNAQQQGGGSVQASFNSDADNRYRGHFEAHSQHSAQGGTQPGGAQGGMQAGAQTRSTRSYDDVRPLYHFGHMASQNPDYSGRRFHEVEPELQRHWGSEQSQRHGSWPEVRGFVEFGYSGHQSGGASTGGVNSSGGATGGASGGTTGGSSGGFHASGSIDTTRDPGNTGP